MKTIIRNAAFLILAITATHVKAQTMSICAGSSTVVMAVNSQGLSNPSYSINPGGTTSSTAAFTVSPASAVTYTLYVTGTNSNSAVVSTSNTVTVQVNSAPVASISPASQSIACGAGVVATATSIALSPTANVTHNWYSPASPNPFTDNGQTSVYPMSLISGTLTTFTCVVVDNITGCSTTQTTEVISSGGGYPSFTLASTQNFSIGCNTASLTNIMITNAQTTPLPGGALSYTVLYPGYGGATPYTTGPISVYTVNMPGTYTVIVRDNSNSCETLLPVSITQNTSSPVINLSAFQNTLSCFNPTVLLQAVLNPAVQYNWLPAAVQANSIIVTSNAAAPTQSIVTTLTLIATNNGNACQSSTTIPVYQNIYPPNALIAASSSVICQDTVLLTSTSTSGIPNNPLPSGVFAQLWQGPFPQPAGSTSAFYKAYTAGTYTMTVIDSSNGCTNTATCNITMGPNAAFVHTITGAQAVFNNVSTNTSTNTTYFWNFGDGTSSTVQNPVHTYLNGGPHLVKLVVSDPTAACIDSVIQAVTVSGVPCTANSNFSMVPTATAQVWDAIPDYPWNIVTASWDWGDGSVSNTLYTSHQYASAGLYNICLSVTVSCVASSSSCTTYSVYRTSQASLVAEVHVVAPTAVPAGLAILTTGEQAWSIAPNPNTGEFKLDLGYIKSGSVRVTISDLTGREVYHRSLDSDSTSQSVQAANLPQGMYLVTITAGGLSMTKRMMVEH